MRTGCMCFSVLQEPRCRIQSLLKGNCFPQPVTLSSFWSETFHNLRITRGSSSGLKLLGSNTNGPFSEGLDRRLNLQPITTKVEGINKNTQSSKLSNHRNELLGKRVIASTNLNINKSEHSEFESFQYFDVQQKTVKSRDLVHLIKVFVFDIETTGLSRENERIVEFALQDLLGGENSTFQTLVNPGRYVPNPHVHGITTHMVNRSGVPRMEDLIPILMHYVKSRQKPGVPVLWVAHNARCFDVPFLIKEFSRCSMEVPPDWLFVDTLPLARELMKSDGSKLSSGTSLQALREYYGIPLVGSAHRAMSDVKSLSLVLQRMTFDLKLPISSLLERSFKASDLIKLKKKKEKKKNES
ncbi:hypothetical protein HHK36_031501 [Tetracentron sinense]|uniref:Exonuclease domain-containing protein n=1 Tax=Tetracentron sinense TaxID=13715 RepID=A0A834YAP4_TETSI|nr:hypothetical protein HHK36_031501 [Tetracentron sinense]